jgi:hypothetical protein
MASLGVIALWQLGVLRTLPEPRSKWLDADKVNGSPQAYSYWKTPDAFVGLASYAATAALASAGPPERWRTQPLLPLAMTGKALIDAAQAVRLTRSSWKNYRAFSFWSLVAAGTTMAAAAAALPEGRAAARTLAARVQRSHG